MLSAPHLRSQDTVKKFYWTLSVSLAPFFFFLLWQEGITRLSLFGCSLAGAVLAETVGAHSRAPLHKIGNGHTFFHVLFYSLMLPSQILPTAAAFYFFAGIILTKEIFGGLGITPFHPSFVALLFTSLSHPSPVILSEAKDLLFPPYSLADPLRSLAEDSSAFGLRMTIWPALLISLFGIFIIAKKYLDVFLPVLFILPLILTKTVFASPLLFLAAFYGMADPSILPLSRFGKRVFAFIFGLLCAVFHVKWPLVTSLAFAMLMMNICTPWVKLPYDAYLKKAAELFLSSASLSLLFLIAIELWLPIAWIKPAAILVLPIFVVGARHLPAGEAGAVPLQSKIDRKKSWIFYVELYGIALLPILWETDFSVSYRLWNIGKGAFFVALFHYLNDALNKQGSLFPPSPSINPHLLKLVQTLFIFLPLSGLLSLLP